MKSLELSVIRSEGIEYSKCVIYFNKAKYIDIGSKAHQVQVYLPLIGELGLELFCNDIKLGEVFIDVLKLERDGLQWLPVCENNSEPIIELPEEVPLPRVLISLCENKNKFPDSPLDEFYKTKEKNEPSNEIIQSFNAEEFNEIDQKSEESGDNDYQHPNTLNQEISFDENRLCKDSHRNIEERCISLQNFNCFKNIKPNLSINFENSIQFITLPKETSNNQNLTQKICNLENVNYQEQKINQLERQLECLRSQLEFESNQNKLRNEIIESMKTSNKIKEEFFEDLISSLNEKISQLIKKKCQNKKVYQEVCRENKILAMKLKENSEQALKNFKILEEKCNFLENALTESQNSRNALEKSFESLPSQKMLTSECQKCFEYKEIGSKYSKEILDLSQKIDIMTEKLNIQEFQNQENLIMTQEYKTKLNELIEENAFLKMQQKMLEEEIVRNNPEKDDLDVKIEYHYPEIISKGTKICRGAFLFNGKKIKIDENERGLFILYEDREVKFSDLKDFEGPKHEKNSFSMEDISNQMDLLKPANLILNRANLRENKLRVLTKQW